MNKHNDLLVVELHGSKHDGTILPTTFEPLDIFDYDGELFLVARKPSLKGGKMHKAVCISMFTAEAISTGIKQYKHPITGESE